MEQQVSALKNIIPNRVKLKPSERSSMFKLNTQREAFAKNQSYKIVLPFVFI